MLQFKKATKEQQKLRLALFGPSGAGKTFTGLRIATGLGGKIAVIDTERGSASKYADRFEFDVLDLPQKDINTYLAGIKAAAQGGYAVLIIDSLTHAWKELLDEVEKLAKAKYRGNTWSAWSEGTPKQNSMVDAILDFPGHVIATMRSKTEWTTEQTNNGKSKPVRVGLAPEQGKGIEYEFDLLMELSVDHIANVIKDRTGKYQDKLIDKPGEDFGIELEQWLGDGAKVERISQQTNGNQPQQYVNPNPATTGPSGERQQANGKPQHPPRPMDPEKTRQFIAALVTYKRSKNADGTQILTDPDAPATPLAHGLFVGKLTEVFAPNDDAEKMRRSVVTYLFGVASSTELTKAQVSAGLDWLIDHKTEDGDYIINAFAIDEARAIERQVLLDAGQQEMQL